MNDLLKPQYTLTVDCDQCPGASCTDCGGTGLIEVCPQCEHLECLCTEDESVCDSCHAPSAELCECEEREPDDEWNLGLTDTRPW